MKILRESLFVLLGIAIGVAVAHPHGIHAQDAKDPSHREQGRISITPITRTTRVLMDPPDRYLGFACSQDQCYIATMD
jgi:hypothetical protein